MRSSVAVHIGMGLGLLAFSPDLVSSQEPPDRLHCGESAKGIDVEVQRRIESDLSQIAPTWAVRTLPHSGAAPLRLLELTREGLRVGVSIDYASSIEDAARSVRCRLLRITAPQYKKVAALGDEAYVLTESHLLFRTGRLVVSVDAANESLETERDVATRLIASVRANAMDAPLVFIPQIGARVRLLSSQIGPGWRVGMFNQTRQVPPCYLVFVFDPRPSPLIALTVPAKAISRLELSRLYPGTPTDPDPGAAAYTGEKWVNVPLDSIVATGRVCPDSVQRHPM